MHLQHESPTALSQAALPAAQLLLVRFKFDIEILSKLARPGLPPSAHRVRRRSTTFFATYHNAQGYPNLKTYLYISFSAFGHRGRS